MKKTLFMETTSIEASKTAAEITSLLVQSGAVHISHEYGQDKEICGLKFALKVRENMWTVALPARVDPIFKIINGRRKFNRNANARDDMAQAKRVAWRQLLRWCEAQLAMVDAGMVEAGEVFLSYAQDKTGVSFFERVVTDQSRLLEAPKEQVGIVDAQFVE